MPERKAVAVRVNNELYRRIQELHRRRANARMDCSKSDVLRAALEIGIGVIEKLEPEWEARPGDEIIIAIS
jgi:hypothetical protein